MCLFIFFFFSSRRRHTRCLSDWSSDVCSSDLDAYPSQWISVLESMHKLDWSQAIPGHGGVQQGKGQLEKLIAYMKDMVAAVKDAIAKGMTLDDAKKSIDLSKHAGDFGPNFPQSNVAAIERTWAELSGKIPD